jgi:phosphohistidine phosphatase SixA
MSWSLSILWLAIVLAGVAVALKEAHSEARSTEDSAWTALRNGGHIALLRHAVAPGTGDPDGFRLDDCGSQRNLSADGREQARRIGDALRARGVRVDHVYSSAWCRCLETARLLDVGPVTVFPPLNSFFRNPGAKDDQMVPLTSFIGAADPDGVYVMVTHQVVITELTNVVPGSGEIVVIRPETEVGDRIVGRIIIQ